MAGFMMISINYYGIFHGTVQKYYCQRDRETQTFIEDLAGFNTTNETDMNLCPVITHPSKPIFNFINFNLLIIFYCFLFQ